VEVKRPILILFQWYRLCLIPDRVMLTHNKRCIQAPVKLEDLGPALSILADWQGKKALHSRPDLLCYW
jgi:hypothetical protein